MKNRRTLESIKREYKLFHNLSENIDNSYSQSPVTFYDEYEAVEAVMNQLSERSRCLAHIIKSHEENANEETLKAAYERLERSDAYFASLSADDQKKIENAFKDPAHEEFLKDKAWHHAYSAYLSTKSIAVSKAVQSAFEIRSKMEEQMNLMTAAAKEMSEIRKNVQKKYPNTEIRTLKADQTKQQKLVDNLQEKMKNLELSENQKNEEYNLLQEKLKKAEEKLAEKQRLVDKLFQAREVLQEAVKFYKEQGADMKGMIDRRNRALDERGQKNKDLSAFNKEHEKIFKEYQNALNKNLEVGSEIRDAKGNKTFYNGRYALIVKRNDHTAALYRLRELQLDLKYCKKKTIIEFCQDNQFNNVVYKYGQKYPELAKEKLKNMSIEEFEQKMKRLIKEIDKNLDEKYLTYSDAEKKLVDDAQKELALKQEAYEKSLQQKELIAKEYITAENQYRSLDAQVYEKTKEIKEKVRSTDIFMNLVGFGREFSYKDLETVVNYQNTLSTKIKKATLERNKIKIEYNHALEELEEFKQGSGKELVEFENTEKEYKEQKEILVYQKAVLKELAPAKTALSNYQTAKKQLSKLSEVSTKQAEVQVTKNAGDLFDIKALRQGSHKNTKEYENMIKALEIVKNWPNVDEKDKERLVTMEDALNNLVTQSNAYLKAKHDQWRRNPSVLRLTRLGYAEAIKEFAVSAKEDMIAMTAEEVALDQIKHQVKEKETEVSKKDGVTQELEEELVEFNV